MLSRISPYFRKLAEASPFSLLTAQLLKLIPTAAATKVKWNIAPRPHYLLGVLRAAHQARSEGVDCISVVEFGVAGGEGLLFLQQAARDVQRETGVRIRVIGFDSGDGLPPPCEDYRDHSDKWTTSDYPMDEGALRGKLSPDSSLVMGLVHETVPAFVSQGEYDPIGFIAFDLDYYSSTRDAMQILTLPGRKTLRRVFLYFDDIGAEHNHRFAGELLAIDEFNLRHERIKIDVWRGVTRYSLFWHPLWLQKMYIAHDLAALSQVKLDRPPLHL